MAQDGLSTVVERAGHGTQEIRVVGPIVECVLAPDDPEAVLDRTAAATTRVVSLTISKGGYLVDPEHRTWPTTRRTASSCPGRPSA